MENINELQSKLLITLGWKQMSGDTSEATYVDETEEDMVSKIIWKRTAAYDIKLPTELAYIISLGADGNPGIGIIMYYTFLERYVKRGGFKIPRGHVLTALDFGLAFSDKFPDATTVAGKAYWEDKWDRQKDEKGQNKVDFPSYWDELFV